MILGEFCVFAVVVIHVVVGDFRLFVVIFCDFVMLVTVGFVGDLL